MKSTTRFAVFTQALFLILGAPAACADPAPPNILWITCEDMSPDIGCYGDSVARTPNLDHFAGEGLRYDNAFSISGVCAPSRSCLITGMYPTTLGTHSMRCNNQPPDHVKCFPEYLRNAGYYCTNNSKQDYNFKAPPTAWDESSREAHWRNRDPDQPFFAVFNFTITHESRIGKLPEDLGDSDRALLLDEKTDPAAVTVPPFYPDTPLIRKHWAHYYDLIAAMDRQAGDILEQLEADGLAENTVVFFYGDHGTGAPRAKRWMYDAGIRVPLMIRWPGKIDPGSATENLVSFVDFSATVLSIAGVTIPGHMQGVPFLGEAAGKNRETIHAARDRMDERYDIIRAITDGRYKYIRNYEPYREYDQRLFYPESFPIMQELRRVEAAGELGEGPGLFFRDTKPLEELYDLEADPFELHDLASAKEHRPALDRLSAAMDKWRDETQDLGLVPEIELREWLDRRDDFPKYKIARPYKPLADKIGSKTVFGRSANDWIAVLNGEDGLDRLTAIKSLGLAGEGIEPLLVDALDDPQPSVAHWAAVSLGHFETTSASTLESLTATLGAKSESARLGAVRALCLLGQSEKALPTLYAALDSENPYARLHAVESLEVVGGKTEEIRARAQACLDDENKYVVRIAEHLLAASASDN